MRKRYCSVIYRELVVLMLSDSDACSVQLNFETLHQGIMLHWWHHVAPGDSHEAWQVPGLDRGPGYPLALEELRTAQVVQAASLRKPPEKSLLGRRSSSVHPLQQNGPAAKKLLLQTDSNSANCGVRRMWAQYEMNPSFQSGHSYLRTHSYSFRQLGQLPYLTSFGLPFRGRLCQCPFDCFLDVRNSILKHFSEAQGHLGTHADNDMGLRLLNNTSFWANLPSTKDKCRCNGTAVDVDCIGKKFDGVFNTLESMKAFLLTPIPPTTLFNHTHLTHRRLHERHHRDVPRACQAHCQCIILPSTMTSLHSYQTQVAVQGYFLQAPYSDVI